MISATHIIILLLCLVVYLVFRLRQVRMNELISKTKLARLERIKNASFIFRILTLVSLLFGSYWFLAFLFGWPAPFNDKLRVVTSQNHIYESPGDMPTTILALWIVKTCLGLVCAGVLLRLFRLYEQGILFSARNVTFIRFFGWWVIIDWVIDYQMQDFAKNVSVSTTQVFVGLLIIFVAWIMDEGRKIQEEQELTV